MILNPTTIEEIAQNREEWAAALDAETGNPCVGATYEKGRVCAIGRLYEMVGAITPDRRSYISNAGNLIQRAKRAVAIDGDYSLYSQVSSDNDEHRSFKHTAALIRALPLPESVTP